MAKAYSTLFGNIGLKPDAIYFLTTDCIDFKRIEFKREQTNIQHSTSNRNRDGAIVGALLLVPEPYEGQQKATRDSPTCSVSGGDCPYKVVEFEFDLVK